MALVLKDRVKVSTTTTGTGSLSLGSAQTGYDDFSVIGDGNTTYYAISTQGSSEWEVGLGTYSSAGPTLSRDTVLSSSNAGSLVNFSAGTKDVYVTYPATQSVNLDANNDLDIDSNTLFVDSSANSVGIGTNSPDAALTVNTIASFGDGTSTTPSIAHKGDLNTGLWFPSADTIATSTDGTERIRITSSGGVSFGSSGTAYGTANQVLTSAGNAPPTWVDNISSVNYVEITSGTTYTVPSNLLYALVYVIGAGGGGGGADCGDTAANSAAGGGGGGGTAIKFYTKAEIGTSATYALGAGGTAGANTGTNGGNGGNSTFTANGTYTTTLTGNGGGFGTGLLTSGQADTIQLGGAGGSASGGDINVSGNDGGAGFTQLATSALGGTGAGAIFGGGGDGGKATTNVAVAGTTAVTYGGGGGGAVCRNVTTGAAGGAGAQGFIWITEYLAG